MIKLPNNLCVDFPRLVDPTKNSIVSPLAAKDGESYHAKSPPVCRVCQKVTCMVCSKCFAASFCSSKCWEKDKRKHSEDCGKESLIVLKTNKDDDGTTHPHYVFQNGHPAGSLILLDDVPVILPTIPKGFVIEKDVVDKPLYTLLHICYGCHKHFCPGEKRYGCRKCGITLCEERCGTPYHSDEECGVVSRAFGHKFSSSLTNTRKYIERYLDICVLRVLLTFLRAETNAYIAYRFHKFQLLSSLPRFKAFSKTKRDSYDNIQYFKLLKTVDRLTLSLAFSKQSRDVLQHVYRCMITFWEPFDQIPGVVSRLLFLDRHFMTQSYCSPNVAVSLTFDSKRNRPTWITYTLKQVKIEKCGHVPVRFDFSPCPIMPISLRMEYLKENGLPYECHNLSKCVRCNDASDSGTNSGSIVCVKCCRGLYVEGSVRGKNLLLTEYPKRWSAEYVETVDWNCEKCGDAVPYSFILEVNRKFMKMYLENVATRFSANMLADAITFVDRYEEYLHPLNGVILRAKYDLVMAAREKHLRECGFNKIGFPLDPYSGEKEVMGIPLNRVHKMRVFPVRWNLMEMNFNYVRLDCLEDCMQYFENCRRTSMIAMEHSVIYTFFSLERCLVKLVMSAYYYCRNSKNAEDNAEFISLGHYTGKMIQNFNRKCIILFGVHLMTTDPLLKNACREMRLFGNIIDRNDDTETLAKLVIQGLGLKSKSELGLMSPEEMKEMEEEEDSKEVYNKFNVKVIIPVDNNDDDGEVIIA